MALVAFVFLGILAALLVAISSTLLFKMYWRSDDALPIASRLGCDLESPQLLPEALKPPAALSPPDDIESLDRGALVVRLHAMFTGKGSERLRSLGNDGVFRTRSGTQITVFHSAERLCIV